MPRVCLRDVFVTERARINRRFRSVLAIRRIPYPWCVLRFKPLKLLLPVAFLRVSLVHCSDIGPTAPEAIVTVSLTPPAATLRIGATLQLSATATAAGSVFTGAIAFTSDNPAVVSISTAGLVRALSIGTALVKASSASGASATALVTVIPGLPASATKSAGDNQTAQVGTPLAIAPSVTVRDSVGNTLSGVPVAFAVASGGGAIAGGSATTNASGVATAGTWTLGTVGTNTLAASVSGLAAVTFTATATPVPLGALTISAGNNQTAIAGGAVTTAPSVLVTNTVGQPVAGVSVTFAVLSGGGSITGASATTTNAGIATAGTWTLGAAPGTNTLSASVAGLPSVTYSATGTASPTLVLSSNAVSLSALTGKSMVAITNGGSGTLSGVSIGSTVYGAGAAGWLTASLSANTAPASLTLSASADGLAAASYTATLTVTANGSNSPQSITVTLTVLGPSRLIVSVQPQGTVSGVALSPQPVVRVVDANGLPTIAAGVVTAFISSGTGTLTGTTRVSFVNGVATFTDLGIVGNGIFSLGFSSSGITDGTTLPFSVAAILPTQLAVITQPTGAIANTVFTTQPVAEIRDGSGLRVLNASSPVTVSLAPGSTGTGALSGTATVNAVNGVVRFTDLRISTSGNYSLLFTSPGLTTTSSNAFSVTLAPPTQLGLAQQPSGGATGSVMATQPIVQFNDFSGARVVDATNAVTATLNGAGGTLSGTTTVNAVNGSASFTNLTVSGAGSYTITFSSAGLTPVTSSSVVITALPPTQLALGTAPGGAATGALLSPQPSVQLRDVNSSLVASATNPVTVALNGAGGTLSGTTTVNAVNGVASFSDLRIAGVGTYTLTFTSGALTAVTSGTIGITTLPPTALGLTTQPSGAVSGAVFTTQPVVVVRDGSGSTVAGASNAVTAAITSGSGIISGTTTVNAVTGVAIFTDLKITGTGAQTLTFSSIGLTPASTSITINAAPAPASVSFGTQQSTLLLGGASSTTATVKDASGNTLTGTSLSYTSRTPGVATVSGTGVITGVAAGTSIIIVSVSPTIADSLLAIVMVPGGQVLITSLNTFDVTQGSTVTVSVFLDMRANTKKLASGSVRVNFEVATLAYVSTAAGAQFSPVKNETNVGTGVLDLTFADASGSSGLVEIAKVTFTARTTAGATGALSLTSTELSASDFSNLLPTTTQVSRPIVLKP